MSAFVPTTAGPEPVANVAASGVPLTTTGSKIVSLSSLGQKVALIANLVSLSGGTGSIAFTVQEVDIGDQTTILAGQPRGSGQALNGAGQTDTSAVLPATVSTYFKVSWTVTVLTGTPSFGVNANLVGKGA